MKHLLATESVIHLSLCESVYTQLFVCLSCEVNQEKLTFIPRYSCGNSFISETPLWRGASCDYHRFACQEVTQYNRFGNLTASCFLKIGFKHFEFNSRVLKTCFVRKQRKDLVKYSKCRQSQLVIETTIVDNIKQKVVRI